MNEGIDKYESLLHYYQIYHDNAPYQVVSAIVKGFKQGSELKEANTLAYIIQARGHGGLLVFTYEELYSMMEEHKEQALKSEDWKNIALVNNVYPELKEENGHVCETINHTFPEDSLIPESYVFDISPESNTDNDESYISHAKERMQWFWQDKDRFFKSDGTEELLKSYGFN